MTWHPPMAYRYSYRTHDGYAMLLADSGGYPRRWIKGPKITPENVETLADRIRSIANLVDRSGVYEMLHDIADELDPPTPENQEPT